MNSENQYIELYEQARDIICSHSSEVMNAVRDAAFGRFKAQGFPSRKVERYKYTDIAKLFEPDYCLNLNRLDIPVDPYQAFRCDVPNLSTSLYFVVNDMFYRGYEGAGVRRYENSFFTPIVQRRVYPRTTVLPYHRTPKLSTSRPTGLSQQ